MPKREPRFEVLWYVGHDLANARNDGNYETKEFYTRKAALKFYEEHKNDVGKFDWWVTHRNADWEVIEDIII